ncbi:MAG: hypothetical protein HN353_11880 [Bdellovibrionales bacterium]|jgi:hypothetical protein|nr:hypothetical protein [Bdellovibrionales bacterium]MBT3526849.1 hypothetical protein [Bdellovibrionales bacterium]MBT7668959.1 hypothetical protein [Bdellovibrionales bacterium]
MSSLTAVPFRKNHGDNGFMESQLTELYKTSNLSAAPPLMSYLLFKFNP